MKTNFEGLDPELVERIALVENGAISNIIIAAPSFVSKFHKNCEAAFVTRLIPARLEIGMAWTGGENFAARESVAQ